MADLVTYVAADGVATITMDDGKRNALSPQMFSELGAAFDQAVADDAAVVLTGRPGTFSAGFDLRVLTAGGPEGAAMVQTGFELAERMLGLPVPVVVACPGHALAMGLFLTLAGDYRIGARGDFKLQANEVAIGITMPFFAIEICRQRLAPAHFHRVVINAEVYAPEDAVAAGMLDRVVDPSELDGAAHDKAIELGGLNRSAFAGTKLRARATALAAVHAGIDADRAP